MKYHTKMLAESILDLCYFKQFLFHYGKTHNLYIGYTAISNTAIHLPSSLTQVRRNFFVSYKELWIKDQVICPHTAPKERLSPGKSWK